MATIYSQQLARILLPKLTCSALLAILLCTTVFISGAYSQNKTASYDNLGPANLLDRPFATRRIDKTNITTNPPRKGNQTMARQPINRMDPETIQKGNEILQLQLEQALAKIEQKQNVQKNKDWAEQISRSPRAVKIIQAFEAAIAIFGQTKPNLEYEVSEYATGNKQWRRSPVPHPVLIQDLLLYNVQVKHEQNKILGDKVTKVVTQNLHLAQQASSVYETPSERLKKDLIMGLVTYMFLKHNNEQKQNNDLEMEVFSSWGQPFFQKKE
jgi:hypothetical protein